MTNRGNTSCIILAAGMSLRFGAPKQFVQAGGPYSLVQKAIDTANSSVASYILVITGAYDSDLKARTRLGRARIIFNERFEAGQSTSIKAGINSVPDDSTAAIIMVADQPFLRHELLDEMIEAYDKKREKNIVALSFRGEPRNPALFDRCLFPELEKLAGDRGAKEIIEKHLDEAYLIDIDDPIVFLDIDTRENLEQAKNVAPRGKC